MATPVNGLTDEAIRRGVHEAFADAGYLTEDGAQSMVKMTARVFEIVAAHRVTSGRDKAANAITRGQLADEVFPGLTSPADALGEAVRTKVAGMVWQQTRTGADGNVQRLVGDLNGGELIMVRCRLGADRTPAVFVTADFATIKADYIGPEEIEIDRRLARLVENREMLIRRQPANARKVRNAYTRHMNLAITAGKERLDLAIEAATTEPDEADAEGDE
jgi:hypothetical protein